MLFGPIILPSPPLFGSLSLCVWLRARSTQRHSCNAIWKWARESRFIEWIRMPVQQPNFFYRLFYLFVYAYTFVRHFVFVYFVFSSFRFLAVSFIANATDIFRFQFGWFFPLVYSRTILSLSLYMLWFFFHFIVLSLDCKCVLMVFRAFFVGIGYINALCCSAPSYFNV